MKIVSPVGALEQDPLPAVGGFTSLDGLTLGVIQLSGAAAEFVDRRKLPFHHHGGAVVALHEGERLRQHLRLGMHRGNHLGRARRAFLGLYRG